MGKAISRITLRISGRLLIFGRMEANEKKWVPWLDGIYIHDCYVVKDLQIDIAKPGEQEDAPRHLILTGKNGSGKSSIIKAIDWRIESLVGSKYDIDHWKEIQTATIDELKSHSALNAGNVQNGHYAKRLFGIVYLAKPIGVHFEGELVQNIGNATYALIPSERILLKHLDNTFEKDQLLAHFSSLHRTVEKIDNDFEKFLVSMKVSSLFHKENGKDGIAQRYDQFLARILEIFRRIFEDNQLQLQFHPKSLSFFFIFDGGRKISVRDVSDGHFSMVMIILSIYARQEKIRGDESEDDSDIPGLVLIDEPELHLHLELQYEIMPLLTELFPKIQFIVATHSPAVISSIRNATVYDLTKREYAPSYIAGESFSSLMESHFGLENEFGPVADKLIAEVKYIYLNGGTKKEKSSAIKLVMEKYQDIITPTLRVELESTLIDLEVESAR
jgi:hypothetical protein